MLRGSLHIRKFSSVVGSGLNVVILGPPGGGKGTIANKLVKDFNFLHISTGDLLRHEIRAGTEIGKQVKSIMDNGGLVDDKLVMQLIAQTIKSNSGRNTLFDGFPRKISQAEMMSQVGITVNSCVNLDIPHEVIVERISNRWVHAASGRTYSYDYNPPKKEGVDDITGEALSQRDDDKCDVVRARLQNYQSMINPLIDYYHKMGVLKTFAGTQSDVIYPNVKQFLSEELQLVNTPAVANTCA